MPLFARALFSLLQNWRSIAALTGLIVATGFTVTGLLSAFSATFRKLWWLAALAAVVMLGREFIRAYFLLKSAEKAKEAK